MNKGIILALVAAFISGLSIFANSVFVAKIDPLVFACVRNAAVAVTLTAILFLTGKVTVLRTLTRAQFANLMMNTVK